MVANYRRDNDGVVWLYDVTNDEILFKNIFFLGFAESKQTFLSYDQAKAKNVWHCNNVVIVWNKILVFRNAKSDLKSISNLQKF